MTDAAATTDENTEAVEPSFIAEDGQPTCREVADT